MTCFVWPAAPDFATRGSSQPGCRRRLPERPGSWCAAHVRRRVSSPSGCGAAPAPNGSPPGWRQLPRARWVGSLHVLDAVDELFASLGLAWGPTGSVGFELATGLAAAGADSDLDVVIRAPEPLPLEDAREIAGHLKRLPTRVDAQLDTSGGAAALAEYARGGRG